MTRSSNSPIDLDHPYSDASDLPLKPSQNQQFGFMAPLHSDIILAIVSYLRQEDCLNCMAVCQGWYNTMPQYSQRFWEKIHFSGQRVCKENQRQTRCLGDHVKVVTLDKFDDEQELYCIMRKLLDWGCTKLKALEFNQCYMENHNAFLDVLTTLAPRLTHLKMLNHGSNIAFSHVFDACPELTHFTYQIHAEAWHTSNVYDIEPVIHGSKIPLSSAQTTKITHLYLDVILDNRVRLYPILRRCPNLRCFIGPSKKATLGKNAVSSHKNYNHFQIDPDQLVNLCPMIASIQGHHTYFNLADILEDVDSYINDSGSSGLHYLDICEDHGGDRIGLCLTRNRDTLEYISLRPYDSHETDYDSYYKWSPMFWSLELPQLRTLICHMVRFDTDSVVALLNNCTALEVFDLHPARMRIGSSDIRSLGTLHQLRSLSLTSLQMAGPCFMMILDRVPALEELTVDICSISIEPPIHRFDGLTKLKHLSLSYITWTDDEDIADMDHAVACFIQCLVMRSKLETILLSSVPDFEIRSLLTVASIPELKICDIILTHLHCSKDALCDFVAKLHETAIEILRMRAHTSLASGILGDLGNLPFLKELYLSPYYSSGPTFEVDGLDLLQLLHKGKCLTGVYFHNVTVTKLGQMPHDQNLSVLVEQEASQYYVLKGSDQSPPPLKKVRPPLKYDVAIKRKL